MMKLSGRVEANRIEYGGVSASAGFASGTVWINHDLPLDNYQTTGDAELEAKRLKNAIGMARMEVATLLKGAARRAADIIAFQLDVLDDETFYIAAVEKLKLGESSFDAWRNVLAVEIAGYQNSNDIVFQARAFDLQDIQERVERLLCEQVANLIPKGAIVVGQNLSPSAFIAHDWSTGGIALTQGSVSSHLAILARQFGVPMIIGIKPSCLTIENGKIAVLEISERTGKFIVSPTAADLKNKLQKARISEDAKREHSIGIAGRPIKLMINLSQLRELKNLNAEDFDGVGLVRTEFLLAEKNQNPLLADEEAQFQAYCEILKWANGKPVFIRTIDAGGDKPAFTRDTNTNFSYQRGLKLSLSLPEFFRIQVRALLRAAALGPLHVTFPMVESQADFDEAFDIFVDEANHLSQEDKVHCFPSIGMMVEVPSVALSLKNFCKAEHFAIGTNDLMSLALGHSRDFAAARPSIDNPQLINLIKQIVAAGVEFRKAVLVCGDAASNPTEIPHLLAAGVSSFSISPPSFSMVLNALHKAEKNGRV